MRPSTIHTRRPADADCRRRRRRRTPIRADAHQPAHPQAHDVRRTRTCTPAGTHTQTRTLKMRTPLDAHAHIHTMHTVTHASITHTHTHQHPSQPQGNSDHGDRNPLQHKGSQPSRPPQTRCAATPYHPPPKKSDHPTAQRPDERQDVSPRSNFTSELRWRTMCFTQQTVWRTMDFRNIMVDIVNAGAESPEAES